MPDHTPTTIELASNSVATVSPSLVFPDRISLHVIDRGAWSNFGIELTPDTARQLAAALVAHADALDVPTITKGITA